MISILDKINIYKIKKYEVIYFLLNASKSKYSKNLTEYMNSLNFNILTINNRENIFNI